MKMKKFTEILGVSMLVVFLTVGSAFAFGTNITISDGNITTQQDIEAEKLKAIMSGQAPVSRSEQYADTWYSDREDQEVETGMQRSQNWDLEGFFFDETTGSLSMVGGYDFVNGYGGTTSGDIFIDVNADSAEYGKTWDLSVNSNIEVASTYGYDYVLDMDFSSESYDVYRLNENTITRTPYEERNQGSGPWQYVSGGEYVGSGSFTYETGLTDADTGFVGGSHNAVSGIDLGFIASDVPTDFIVHFTMACGNDNLMGEGTIGATNPGGGGGSSAEAPEPATMLLLGIGLFGLASLRKRFNKKG
jgi:hypothetical protein